MFGCRPRTTVCNDPRKAPLVVCWLCGVEELNTSELVTVMDILTLSDSVDLPHPPSAHTEEPNRSTFACVYEPGNALGPGSAKALAPALKEIKGLKELNLQRKRVIGCRSRATVTLTLTLTLTQTPSLTMCLHANRIPNPNSDPESFIISMWLFMVCLCIV